MSFRNIFIEHPAKISNKYNQLIIKQDHNYSIPIEDINTVVVDNMTVTITASTIFKLGENKVALFFCNGRHLPCSITLPFENYYSKLDIITAQFKMGNKAKGRMWQKIIKKKILNQAKNLKHVDDYSYLKMQRLFKNVLEYDSSYCEANAARVYFKILFDDNFTRRDSNVVNGSLNYGYSLVRGIICRDICSLGLEPSLGIFHHNKLNAFNLSDDLIEPFRGLIDNFILKTCLIHDDESIDKTAILKILFTDVLINGQYQSLSNAVGIYVSSYQKCCINDSSSGLILPDDIVLRSHEYK